PFLEEAYVNYARGFEQDLNHFYPGLNALAMVGVQMELAARLPQRWVDRFESPAEAEIDLAGRGRARDRLAAAVGLAIAAAEQDPKRREREGRWLTISKADLACLTSRQPGRVEHAYREALANAEAFYADAVQAQLQIYRELGLFPDNVQAA